MIMDALSKPLFDNDHQHNVMNFEGRDIDVIKSAGNIWLYGATAMQAAGVPSHAHDGYSRHLGRVKHPDKIKITDTPFRFTSGNRNRSVLVSPKVVFDMLDKTSRGRNPIMTINFTEWLTENVLEGLSPLSWSPARFEKDKLEPVFRETIIVKDKNETEGDTDPLRPVGVYLPIRSRMPIRVDEVEFCLCTDERLGIGKCWCCGGVRIRSALPAAPYLGGMVIDEEDTLF
ncbi:hypothetical protein DS909_10725 [Phaeobacter gallaeciensis]|uniref:Bro-N domain-containing protein n=1 Tax=Phaeobacter gallaeciensis TaxID=60890 RepID=A0A366X2M6_9RHOB|nr:hypothetical protein [Phaeobacter gallaeciensis]RBW55571.1 hypothetical protein DS909_10725 [Phaeobacter gallaeciensis]